MKAETLVAPIHLVRSSQVVSVTPTTEPTDGTGLGRDSLRLRKTALADKAQAPVKLSHIGEAVSKQVPRPYLAGNTAQVFIEGKEAYPQLISMIDGAKEQINMEYFALHNDETGRAVADLLKRKAGDGVEVNMILDYLSNHSNPLVQEMRDAGVRVNFFTNGYKIPQLELPKIVDHRKLTLVDGKAAMSGGMNLGSEYQNHWHDDMFKLEGPAVSQYYGEFEKNWNLSAGEPLKKVSIDMAPKGVMAAQIAVNTPKVHEVHQSFLAAFGAAKESIHVNSPYFVNEEIVQSLIDASQRGVKVLAEIPTIGDNPAVDVLNDSVHKRFEAAGVTVHRFDTKNPDIKGHDHMLDHFDHAKVTTVDGVWSAIGTANMDDMSQKHIQEFNLHVDDPAFAKDLETRFFQRDFATFAKATTIPEMKTWQKLAAPVLNALRRFF